MIKFLTKNINLEGICRIRTFAANRFQNSKTVGKNVDSEAKINKEVAKFKARKAEVEKFRAEIWRRNDKILYYGAFTLILRKQDEIKEIIEDTNYEEEYIKKRYSSNG
ncbi:uncharacterized protein LOC129952734 [Eupeodes corollae]|uniref:uncharacterized protein LOC129952734 n=1 Tax=Eupeodes corollae TaxID=290404 RepID=UPI002491A5FF|nr:uncharacterized protein LOC129952734 [Eupeodes corollae]